VYDFFGLPLHPLVVHAVVVLLPLAALGVIACVVVAPLRRRYAGLTLLGLVAGTGATLVAAASGQELAARVGTPALHMALGEWLPRVAIATLVPAAVWYFLQRGKERQPLLAKVLGAVSAVAAAAAIVLTVLVGHSGATAVWGGTAAAQPSSSVAATNPAPTASGSGSTTPSSTTSTVQSYTLDQVKQHNSAADCWAAINGGVYNLTEWVSQHPGGSDRIVPLCGTDASAAFNNQHSGQGKPESTLTRFYIGDLAA
jgi:uncharacterized membrane protein